MLSHAFGEETNESYLSKIPLAMRQHINFMEAGLKPEDVDLSEVLSWKAKSTNYSAGKY